MRQQALSADYHDGLGAQQTAAWSNGLRKPRSVAKRNVSTCLGLRLKTWPSKRSGLPSLN